MPKPKEPRSLDSFAEERESAIHVENAAIARDNRALKAALREKDQIVAEIKTKLGLYEWIEAAGTRAPPVWLTPKASKKDQVAIPSLVMGDIHWGEITKPEQIGGINAYNRQIAEMRVRRGFENSVKVSRQYLSGVSYEGFNLMLPGDNLSGIIHEELLETNQETIMESLLSVVEHLEAGINFLVTEFGKVNISCVVGNHGRNSKRPRAKNRAQDNFDWLVYKLIERDMANKKGVTMQVAEGADALVRVYNTKYLLTHGDQFHGGSGISGLLAPLLLGSHRKSRRQLAAGQPYDIMVMGHWHQSLWFPNKGLIVSGAVKGYDEFAYISNFEPEPPQCAFWLTTPEHGVTISAPIFVSKREEEGW